MSALLLRLFESEHFSLQLAVAYLRTYADSIGVTAYLVKRLVEFPDSELEFYWPQLCHLLVTRPTESVALENLILDRCDTSIHLAMLTLWYLQASLMDLQKTPTSPAFAICRRALMRVQHVIFSDHLPTPNGLSTAQTLGITELERVRPNVNPALVGLGMMALAAALPTVALSVGATALAQGRRAVEDDVPRNEGDGHAELSESSSSDEEPDVGASSRPPGSGFGKARPITNGTSAHSDRPRPPSFMPGKPLPQTSEVPLVSYDAPRQLSPKSRRAMPQSQSVSHLPPGRRKAGPGSPLATRTSGPSRPPSASRPSVGTAEIPATARFPPSIDRAGLKSSLAHTQSASVPILPLTSASLSNTTLVSGPVDYLALSQTLPKPLLLKLLRSYACRAQLDLLTSLQDISTRLILVPKPARLSALRAELTVLNHGLPRGCCLGIGCAGEGHHHRVIRISPSEAVVLNSADRAPFLLQVEILEGDLDFDASRRQNAEDVRKVLDEREAAIARQSYRSTHPLPKRKATVEPTTGEKLATAVNESFGNAMRAIGIDAAADGAGARPPPGRRRGAHARALSDVASIAPDSDPVISSPPPSRPVSLIKPPSLPPAVEEPKPPRDNEEVDLVEQLYGDTHMHDLVSPVQEEPYSPKPIQNRVVDEAAWQRGERRQGSLLSPELPRTPALASSGVSTPDGRGGMTLDQYAERMRMAAVMLAQLSASQQPTIGITGTATELVGAGVGLGAGLVGAAFGRLPFGRTTSQAGQGSTGVAAKVDTSTAASAGAELTSPRQRILSPADATAIRERIMREMMDLEAERMERMRLDSRARTGGWTTSSGYSPSMSIINGGGRGEGGDEDVNVVQRAVNKDDPSGAVLRESWADKRARIRAASPYGHLAAWDLISVIVKTGADLRQEQLAVQLIREFGRIWADVGCPHWVRYFRILVTSDSTGLMETITDAVSVHSLKKEAYAASQTVVPASAAGEPQQPFVTYTLYNHFVDTYGDPSTSTFRKAQDSFMKSLASYSVICYLLQIKDRHNGNILIDRDGHVIHIDFGFLLSNSPGSLGFEMAPFKLPQDYIDILGGITSEKFADFRKLVKQSFWEARRHAERIIMIVELMQKDSNLPCFSSGEQTAQLLRERFQLSSTRAQCDEFVDRLIDSSALSVFTRLYDAFQAYSQGIL